VYRHGEMRDCGPIWSDLWFCLRIRGWSAENKAAAIAKRWKERENEAYEKGPSSEDVWEARTEKVARAFDRDPDGVPVAPRLGNDGI
jgi:hypothetical protein